MTGVTLRNPVILLILAIVFIILVSSTSAVVPETRQAVITRFGEPVRTINRFRPGESFGESEAGLHFRWPFVDQIVWIDKRILDVEMEPQQVLSTDQLRLNVDAFARYRIVDPLRMLIRARTEDNVSLRLQPILASSLRNELGKRPFAALLSPERGQLMDNIQKALDRVARQYGAQIVDVRITRVDLPDGTPLEAAFQRMRTARQQEALTIRAQGAQQAQIIRAEADAAAARTYAESFGKDPVFYDFYRAMQSYRQTFGVNGNNPSGESSIVLSPSNDYLKEFHGGGSR